MGSDPTGMDFFDLVWNRRSSGPHDFPQRDPLFRVGLTGLTDGFKPFRKPPWGLVDEKGRHHGRYKDSSDDDQATPDLL